ncbi:TPA: iron-sulfur cluster assembly scaffold protein [Legionella feeleii]
MMYNELVESCFFSPTHVGVLDQLQPLCAHYHGGEAGRGDVFDFYLCCDAQGRILKARFKAYGNPYLIAAAEWLCRQLEGTLLETHPRYDHAWLAQELELPKVRYHVALQIEDGYKEIVRIMKAKLVAFQ